MQAILLVIRLVLAAVFVLSGLTKLADRSGTRKAIIDFGLPDRLAMSFAFLLPIAELLVAVALVPVTTAWWGALGALALLVLFSIGIALNLARGKTPDCHCFGQLHSAPIGWRTLVRNGALALGAGLVVWQGPANPGASVGLWLSGFTTAEQVGLTLVGLLVPLIAVMALLLFSLWRQQARLLVRIVTLEEGRQAADSSQKTAAPSGLPVNTPAPDFALTNLSGETVTLKGLRKQKKPVLLVFSDPGCGPCNDLMTRVSRWQREHVGQLSIAVVSRGTMEANQAKATEQGLETVILQKDWEVSEVYKVPGTPSAVLVNPDGMIGSELAVGQGAIDTLVNRALGKPSLQAAPQDDYVGKQPSRTIPPSVGALRVGERAPSVTLPDLGGRPTDLTSFRGHDTLLLFWNPGCGFCQRMLPDLKAWEGEAAFGDPRLLVVSSGSVEANQEMGLRSTVIIDEAFSTGAKFGTSGTPSAVLIDAEGRIASEVAVGAPAVLELARRKGEPRTMKAPAA